MFGFFKGYRFNKAQAAIAIRIQFLRLYMGDKVIEEYNWLTQILGLYLNDYYAFTPLNKIIKDAHETLVSCIEGRDRRSYIDYIPTMKQLNEEQQISFINDLLKDEILHNRKNNTDAKTHIVNFMMELFGTSAQSANAVYDMHRAYAKEEINQNLIAAGLSGDQY